MPALEGRFSRRREKSKEAEIGGPFSRSIYYNVSGMPCRRRRSVPYDYEKLSLSSQCGSDIPFYPGIHAHNSVPLSSLYDAVSMEGYLEVCSYICMKIRKRARMFAYARTRSRPSNPLIGFIRASSITLSQGYIPSPSSSPTTRIYRGNFALAPPRDTPRGIIKRIAD